MMFPVLSRQKTAARLRGAWALCAVPLLLFTVPALAEDGIGLNISNDGIVDIFVTVFDMNTNPYTPVLQHERINGFTKVPIFASVDAKGRANISWSAIGVDESDEGVRQCGQGIKAGLEADALVSVHADSAC
jgi:hypothetical protein